MIWKVSTVRGNKSKNLIGLGDGWISRTHVKTGQSKMSLSPKH